VQVTYIVTNAYKALFLEKVGLKTIEDVPKTIPILRWEWVASGKRKAGLGRWHDYATYTDHVVLEPDMSASERESVLTEIERKKSSKGKARASGATSVAAAKFVNNHNSGNDPDVSKISYVYLPNFGVYSALID
jgi:hypothetical protein